MAPAGEFVVVSVSGISGSKGCHGGTAGMVFVDPICSPGVMGM